MSSGTKGLMNLPAPFRVPALARDAIDAALGRGFSRYTRHYRQHRWHHEERTGATGLSIVGGDVLGPDAVRVDVAIAATATPETPETPETPPEGASRRSIHDFLDSAETTTLAVLGGPGSGRTTLLRQLAHDTARRDRGRRIPVFVSPRRLAGAVAERSSLPALLRADPPRLRYPEPAGWWERQLRDGNCLILLDDLDEIADETERRRAAQWIAEQADAFGGNAFVVTSRPGGYRRTPVPGARALALRPLSRDQVDGLLRAWPQAGDLTDRLDGAPEPAALAANPLLLTMIALTHHRHGTLPADRVDLYERTRRATPWRRDPNGDTASPATPRWDVLARLAFATMTARRRDVDAASMPPPAEATSTDWSPAEDTRTLRHACADGVLTRPCPGRYAFVHHTIGEYLAARHIIDHGLDRELGGHVDDPWWTETIGWYAAIAADPGPLVEACLDNATEPALAIALSCADNDGLDPALRQRLLRLERDAYSPTAETTVRRAVARATVSRGLGEPKRLGDSGFYRPAPVTENLYRLYRHDAGEAGGSILDPDRPVGGLWPGEVVPFVDWINATVRRGDRADPPSRLPNRDETELIRADSEPAAASGPPPIWRTSARGPELPFTVSRQRLLSTVAADIAAAGLRTSAMLALLLDEATTMKRDSAPLRPDFGGTAIHDRVDTVTAAADVDGFRRLIAGFGEIPVPRDTDNLVPADAQTVRRFDDARAAAVRESLKRGMGKAYRDRRPESFGWLPPSAAAFTDRRHTAAARAAADLAHHDDGDAESRLAEILLSRAGATRAAGLRIVLGNPAPASRNRDIALRETVAAPGRWHESVSRDLAERVRRVLDRREVPRSPSVLRLSGLIAAAEFEAERDQLSRDACLNIVALVTFLDHRTGTDHAGEALILVRD